jgi:hypothetical protein
MSEKVYTYYSNGSVHTITTYENKEHSDYIIEMFNTNNELINVEIYDNDILSSNTTYVNNEINSIAGEPAIINYNEFGDIIEKRWFKNGVLHNDTKPARVVYDVYEIYKYWYQYGKIHRNEKDLPALIVMDYEYREKLNTWYQNGVIERLNNKPALIEKNNYNNIVHEVYFKNGIAVKDLKYNSGLLHSEFNPSYITWDNDGNISEIRWYKHGKIHSYHDEPAKLIYDNNQLIEEYWYNEGMIHRDTKPAYHKYLDGEIYIKKWYTLNKIDYQSEELYNFWNDISKTVVI